MKELLILSYVLQCFNVEVVVDLRDPEFISSQVLLCCSFLNVFNRNVLQTALSPNLVLLFIEDKQQFLFLKIQIELI